MASRWGRAKLLLENHNLNLAPPLGVEVVLAALPRPVTTFANGFYSAARAVCRLRTQRSRTPRNMYPRAAQLNYIG